MSDLSATTLMNIAGMGTDSLHLIVNTLAASMDDLEGDDRASAEALVDAASAELINRGELEHG